jgi:type II secretory pathway component PulC
VTPPAQARAAVRIPRATDSTPPAAAPRPRPPGDAKTTAAPTQSVPPAVADLVPNLYLQAVVYSETPTERLVFINNRKYVEGQTIEGRVLLERITTDSVILSYEGTRFTLSRP